jgi:glycosyltransferase involved in cell wall biosynthesis
MSDIPQSGAREHLKSVTAWYHIFMKDLWLLIPAYNESPTLGGVIERSRPFCGNILVVDDGSSDTTSSVAQAAGGVVLRHQGNRGKGEALKTGFSWLLAKGCKAVITMDGDGQHDPSEIPKFAERYHRVRGKGFADVLIVGARERRKMPRYRAVPNRIGEALISLAARRHILDTQSGYRLYSRGVLEGVSCRSSGFDMETEILIKAARKGVKIEEIPVTTIYQENYRTHFRPVADFYRISIMVLRNLF